MADRHRWMGRSHRRMLRFGHVPALVATLALAPWSAAGAQDDSPVDLSGVSATIGTAQAQVLNVGVIRMIELLEEWGAEVERVELPTITGLEAIIAERIDVASRSSDEVILGNSRDVPIRAFASPTSTMHYSVIGAPGITEIADLRGKNIGTSGPGGFNSMLFRYMLDQEGINPDTDVQMVPIGGSSERAAAVLAGQVDAVIVYIDNWIALRERGADIELVGHVAQLVPGLSPRAIFAPADYLEENQELALGIACANLETNQWINASKDEFVEYTVGHVPASSEEEVAAFYDVAQEIGMFATDPDKVLDPAGYTALADLMLDAGEIDKPVDGDEVVDRSYLREAAEMGCGQ